MITEAHVLQHCMHNSDHILETVFFPQFKDEFESTIPVKTVGYYGALFAHKPIDFEQWKRLRYKEFRQARYPSLAEQQDMQFHDAVEGTSTWLDCIKSIKAKYPKLEMEK